MSFTPPEWTPSDRIRKMRETLGLEQRELAARSGLNKDTIVNCEKGKRAISVGTYAALSTALGAPVEWLRDGVVPSDT